METDFQRAIEDLMTHQDTLADAAHARADYAILERFTEAVARARGVALRLAKTSPEDVPALTLLKNGVVKGFELILRGETDRGVELARLAHAVRDVAYPDSSLMTPESQKLARSLRDG